MSAQSPVSLVRNDDVKADMPPPPPVGTPIGKEDVIGDTVTSREDHRVSGKRLYLLGAAILVLAVIAAIAASF